MLTSDFIVLNTNTDKLTPDLIGGKALGLHKLQTISLKVPTWATISTHFFGSLLEKDLELQNLLKQENAEAIRTYIKNLCFEKSDEQLLKGVWDHISKNNQEKLAVRSSAADEDGAKLSFAGQMDSYLEITCFSNYLKAIKDCWASLYGDRAVAYRIQHGINPWGAKMAVIVQQMLNAKASGVVFTTNPINQKPEELLVSSIEGLGEDLVSGKSDADTYVLDRKGEILEKQHVTDALTPNQLRDLTKFALKAEKAHGAALDIEFSLFQDQIYFLQARPITSLKKKDNLRIWDNSNIVESYSGVTTPLTFSFIRKAYYAVYWQFCETLGVSKKDIFKNRSVLSNMLGLIQGRVYYNLLNWYELISMMPGFEYNKEFMEQMMGLQVIKESPKKVKGRWSKYFLELPRLIKVASKMTIAHIQLPKKIAEFHKNFNQIYSKYSVVDFSKKTPAEMLDIYRTFEEEILWKWKSPISNDFEAMIFYGLLKKLTLKWEIDDEGILQNDLLSGEGDIKSTKLITDLIRLAKDIEENAKLKALFVETEPEKALSALQSNEDFSKIHLKFQQYLKTYGVRCINEMKLESIPIKDDPLFCIATMQNYLRNGIPDLKAQEKREKLLRKNAEDTLKKRLKGFRLFFYNWILKNSRRAIKNRENQRFARTEAYSLVRTMMQSIGRQWEDKSIIDHSRDIFYLEMEEIWSYIEGASTCVNLKKLIQLRKEEFSSYESENPDDHIQTEGEVYFRNVFAEKIQDSDDKVIKGLGCCSGIVENTLQVVLSPDKNLKLNNEIMVAKQTDPGWGILFPSISGLIVEKGSMLSHSAIVAREMGIPAVIGVKNATKIFNNNDFVRLDGSKGTIEFI